MAFATVENITQLAAERWRFKADDPRLGQLMGSLIEHLHAFARENNLTNDELLAACDFLARTGQACTAKRQEFILGSDTIGLSMLVNLLSDSRPAEATQATLLGPFYMLDSPEIAFGGRLPHVSDDDGVPLIISGRVLGLDGTPVAGAKLDVWQADHKGVYEAELVNNDEMRHRAIVRTLDDGIYMFRTVVPVDYPVPSDGPIGQLFARTDISNLASSPSSFHRHCRRISDTGNPCVRCHVTLSRERCGLRRSRKIACTPFPPTRWHRAERRCNRQILCCRRVGSCLAQVMNSALDMCRQWPCFGQCGRGRALP